MASNWAMTMANDMKEANTPAVTIDHSHAVALQENVRIRLPSLE